MTHAKVSNIEAQQVAPWRVLRPFDQYPQWDLEAYVGKLHTVFRLVDDWYTAIRPGDPVELTNSTDLVVWMTGIVSVVKLGFIEEVPLEDIQNAGILPEHYGKAANNPREFLAKRLAEFYETDVNLGTIITSIIIRISTVSIPENR